MSWLLSPKVTDNQRRRRTQRTARQGRFAYYPHHALSRGSTDSSYRERRCVTHSRVPHPCLQNINPEFCASKRVTSPEWLFLLRFAYLWVETPNDAENAKGNGTALNQPENAQVGRSTIRWRPVARGQSAWSCSRRIRLQGASFDLSHGVGGECDDRCGISVFAQLASGFVPVHRSYGRTCAPAIREANSVAIRPFICSTMRRLRKRIDQHPE